MSRLPDKIVVGFQTLRLDPRPDSDPAHVDIFGMYSSSKERISYQETQAGAQLVNTMLHETLHAVWYTGGLQDQYPHKEQEQIVTVMANGLTQVFRDNQEFVRELLKESKK